MNKLKGIVGILLLCLLLTGCSNKRMVTVENLNQSSPLSMFIEVENGLYYKVIYHRKTKVMYIMSKGPYNCGNATVMVGADGLPLLYEDD